MTAKAKSVADGCVHCSFLRFPKSKIQIRIQLRVVCKMVYSWWHNIILHCHNAGNSFNYTGSTKALTSHAVELGLILLSCGVYANTIRVLVPLTVEDEILEEALSLLERALRDVRL